MNFDLETPCGRRQWAFSPDSPYHRSRFSEFQLKFHPSSPHNPLSPPLRSLQRRHQAPHAKSNFLAINTFACLDGHHVSCRSEILIDNWLYHHEIPHAYGRPVPAGDGTPLISGFYLPAPKVYIEFWRYGIDPDTAIEVHQKRALYRLYRCRLVEVTPTDLQNLDSHLSHSLARHGVSVLAFA